MKKNTKPPGNLFGFVVFAMLVCFLFTPRSCLVSQKFGDEVAVMLELGIAKTPAAREELAKRMESIPEKILPFYGGWLRVHDINPFRCWSDSGYDASRSGLPRDIQLLAAADYGISDIDNGGFEQFFSNSTGVMAPEILEWLERAQLKEMAEEMRRAIALFGPTYPRLQAARREILARIRRESPDRDDLFALRPGEKPGSWNEERERYDEAANRWLKETCGIRSLRQKWGEEPK